MSRPARITLWIVGGIAALLAVLSLAIILILPSAWFRERVRERLISEIERVTGGRAEIGAFYWDWKTLHVQVRPFVLHGTESAGEKPLIRAEAIQVWLHVVSFMKRDIDVRGVEFDHPEVNVLVDAQGHTNFPTPKVQRKSEQDPIQQLLNLAVKEFRIKDGYAHYGDQKIPLDLEARNLAAVFDYDFNGPKYHGSINMERLNVKQGQRTPIALAFESKVTLEPNHVRIEQARMAMPHSYIEANGQVVDLKSPSVELNLKVVGDLAELGKPLNLPQPSTGTVTFNGKGTYSAAQGYLLAGRVNGHGIAIHQDGADIRNIGISSDLRLDAHNLLLRGMTVSALDGKITGQAEIREFKTYKVNGTVEGVSLQSASRLADVKNLPYNARLSGPFELTGSLPPRARDLKVAGTINVSPAGGPVPLSGDLQVAFDQKTQQVQFGNSILRMPSTTVNFRGTLGDTLHVALESSNLNDILPALSIGSDGGPPTLPVKLEQGGTVRFEGDVRGKLSDPQIAGTMNVQNVTFQDQKVDTLAATFTANKAGAEIQSVALGQDQLRLNGNASIGLSNWKLVPSSSLAGTVTLRNAQLAKLIAKSGQNVPADGIINADIKLTGTYGDPHATGQINVANLSAYGEKFDRFRATLNYAGTGVEVINGELDQGTARIQVAGAYEHPVGNWKSGRVRFDVNSENWTLQQVHRVEEFRPGITGRLALQATGTAEVHNLAILLNRLNGKVSVQDLVVDKKPIGNLAMNATTTGAQLAVGVAGDLRGSKVLGNGNFQLSGDYPGSGTVQISPMKLSTIQDLVTATGSGKQAMPMDGVVAANITFSGPVRKPDLMHARLEIPRLEIRPVRVTQSPKQNQDLTLRNSGPIVVEATGKMLKVQSAKLVGPDTNIEGTGTINLADTKAAYDLKMNGNLNLVVLEDFQPGLISSGVSTINATVRGTLARPQLLGRLKFANASFYMLDFPNGLDQVNGEILFDQNRATIVDRLTAETGGGQVAVSGFVGIGAGELTYRLQTRAEDVRVRYPEGVSTTASAQLSLSGTSTRSMLTGIVTVKRVGFNPRTDIGGLLASTATPIATPTTPNELLRNLYLDLHVESVPNLQFQASMTNNLQAEVDLRVRGTAAKPALSGRINVNQGDITFFGNKYTIDRGDIAFYNQAKIEPVIDLDLETRVRGILVNISLTGTLSKLNVSYRSDPPLQSNEIIALLAVGRTPGSYSALAASQTVTQGSMLQTGGSALLGQAVANPLSNRLQRFFGVSKLKIDPLLTGVNAVPQARITLEQQISKDVTLTYVQNITQANQQIVRLEWNLNRNWSIVAVREENGVFGVDFFYKKNFR